MNASFVSFYQGSLGTSIGERCEVKPTIIAEGMVLTDEQQRLLECNFNAEDVKAVMRIILNDKAPSKDGYNNYFFEEAGGSLGEEVTTKMLIFFTTGQWLKVVNVTYVTLIPKVKSPSNLSDFRPITC